MFRRGAAAHHGVRQQPMIPAAVQEDLAPLLLELHSLGVRPINASYNAQAFGNYCVELGAPDETFHITRDRGQYLIDGEQERINAMGFSHAFDSRQQFFNAVLAYARAVV